ncbi:MAG TPA: hypothetical protein VLI54_02350 [Bacillota bacterium]|nr:hypothetical protein [Bacillota bacterium]
MIAGHPTSPFPERVTAAVRKLMAECSSDVAIVRASLGLDAIALMYDATCEALSLGDHELLERAAILDAHPTHGDTAAHAERRYFGSILESYHRNSSTYQYAGHSSEAEADAKAMDSLRQAYAERTFRLALLDTHEDYSALLNNPAFNASLSLIAALAYKGCRELHRPAVQPA